MGTNDTGRLHPEYVAEAVIADIEGEVANGSVLAERNPGTFLLGRADEGALHAMAPDHIPVELGHIDDFVRG
jgi:hypothetical protein